MTALTDRAIKSTYTDLLQVSNSGNGVDASLRNVSDGEGTASALELSTTSAKIQGDLVITGDLSANTVSGSALGNIVTAATAAQVAASSSATAAATSATDASNSATSASTSATAAEAAKTAAQASETASAASETASAASETAAASSETAAAASQAAAAASEAAAAGSATSASSSATSASTSASGAATSATNAANSESNAATSQSSASTSASSASTSASSAATSATAAAGSATSASNSASSAAADLATFQGQYHGASATAPTTGLDTGDLYFDTVANAMKVYDGSSWVAAYISSAGMLAAANNLSDVSSASASRTNLGLGTIATQAANSVAITGGSISGITDLAVADGGTGASTASAARTNLGVAIGADVQAYDAGLNDIAGLAVTDGNFVVGNGANWVAESGATARTSLGLGTMATQAATGVDIDGGTIDNTVIGDTTPAAGTFSNLTIAANAGSSRTFGVGETSNTTLVLQGGGNGTSGPNIELGLDTNNYYDASTHIFRTIASSEVMRVDAYNSRVGIGRTPTTNKLEVAGTIESTSGGFKFPDGSTQSSAGASTGKAIAMAIVFGG